MPCFAVCVSYDQLRADSAHAKGEGEGEGSTGRSPSGRRALPDSPGASSGAPSSALEAQAQSHRHEHELLGQFAPSMRKRERMDRQARAHRTGTSSRQLSRNLRLDFWLVGRVARADESFLEMSAGLPDLVPSKRLLTFACEAAKAVGVVHICMMLYRMA
ncbi:hypothetical protein AXG93_4794s1060 [Marchantia polymorpha subsp. ruderalis]|uniref:Uncharacterized protein n=1 Tax=Marchantia polymorpha subsp. ruderalis TaxID=1480154 RepID=A0A176VF12_MARPO|nr:hypothetical protein AXG93_4794s1060 [Marchantia polymorpha subsp. ruderalis]